MNDPIDFFIGSTCQNEYFGQFIFTKTVLCEHGVLSKDGKGGKRAMRVNPPWDKTTNRQAKKTQMWQMACFLEIPPYKVIDCGRSQMLYKA